MRVNVGKISLFAPLFVGAFFFCAGAVPVRSDSVRAARASAESCEGRVPRGVTVDGLSVGGTSKRRAEKQIREQIAKNTPVLIVEAPSGKYVFGYPEISFTDDVFTLLSQAKKGGRYETTVSYRLGGEAEAIERICADNRLTALDAETRFSADGFAYEAERIGTEADGEALKEDVDRALAGEISEENGTRRFPVVTLKTRRIPPGITLSKAKADSVKLSSFTTCFNADDVGRSANIALAASKIDGTTVFPKEEFSFNATVGARTKDRGFREAKVISGGEFIVGTGGGVCQVSTTLYNAALTAGMEITARRSHSLAVAYVEPSRDAMVSSLCDFRFKNPKSFPVYLSAKVNGDRLTVTVYGRNEGYSYRVVSKVTGEIPPPPPEEKEEEEGVIRKERAGITSEAYLEVYRYGCLIERKKVREDSYAPIRGIVGKKPPSEEKGEPSSSSAESRN